MTGPNPAAGNAATPPAPTVDDVSDPDEDDLDDLDDMLDDFSTMKVHPPKPKPSSTTTPSTSGPAPTASSTPPPGAPSAGAGAEAPDDAAMEALLGDDEFTKELAKNMANLFGDTDMEAQLKSFMQEFTGEDGGQSSSAIPTLPEKPPETRPTPASGAPPTAAHVDADVDADTSTFQNRINDTIRRLQESNRQATEATTSSSNAPPADDFMATVLQQLAEGGATGAVGGHNEEDFSKLLLGMMQELTHKEILYEPMKELDDKFPRWLEENKAKLSAEDLNRYELQRSIVRDIVARYDRKGYADSDPADREYIVDKMQKMQGAGAPPPDLVGDMSSAHDMLNMDEGCNPQ